MVDVVWRTIAAFVFASVLVLSSETQPHDISTQPLVPCYDPNGGE